MAIYPIVDGQKSVFEDSKPDPIIQQQPVAAATNDVPRQPSQEDLVDFGQNEVPVTKPADTPVESPQRTPDEIEKLLSKTGKPAEGPLIDFTQDLKKDLPSSQQDQPNGTSN
jgi:hypothetical protein